MAQDGGSRDSAFASMVVARFRTSEAARRPREDAWDTARERYDPDYVDKAKVGRPPYHKSGYVYRVTNNQLSNLMQATEANGRYCNAFSTTPDFPQAGPVVTQFVEYCFRLPGSTGERGNEDRLERAGFSGLLYGDGAVWIDWLEAETKFGPRLSNVPLKDYFPDWRGNRWHIVRRWMNFSDLVDIATSLSAPVETDEIAGVGEDGEFIYATEARDGGRAIEAVKRIEKEIRSGKRPINPETLGGGFDAGGTSSGYSATSTDQEIRMERVDDDVRDEEGGENERDPFIARVECLYYAESHEDGVLGMVVPSAHGGMPDDIVIYKAPNPYGVCPCVHWSPSTVDNEFWGYGISEIVGHKAETLDYFERSAVRLAAKSVDATFLYRRNLRLPPQFLKNPTGKAQAVDDIATAVGYVKPNVDPAAYPFIHNFIRQQADESTGSSPEQRGQTGSAGSATEAAIAEAGGNTNHRLIFRRWRRFVEQIGRVFLAMGRVHITRERAIAVVGRDAETLLRLKPEYLKGEFEVRFGGSLIGSNTAQDIANMNSLMQVYGAMGVLDVSAMARRHLTMIGVTNPDEFLVQDAGRPKVSANDENVALLEFGQQPKVHPGDNHAEHLAKHQRVMQQLGQDPGDPRLPLMQDHILEHVITLQQAQQTQGAGAGPSPMMPQQRAGGPGEPQSLNSRTADISRMRQEPNRMANGQAPGGVVPNRMIGQMASSGGPQR